MRALRWFGREDVRLEDVDSDGPLQPDFVEVEVAYCGICGSDLTEYRNGPFAIRGPERPHPITGVSSPVTLGHEFAGRVAAVGTNVRGIEPGDRVAADACLRCGTCAACVEGRYNQCPSGGSIGLHLDGALAERVRFPAYCAVRLPDLMDERIGALLEPLAVGLHALDRLGARPGQSLVVLGFGPIGASCALVAQACGLHVFVAEPNHNRRARASELGFDIVESDDLGREIRIKTNGGADLALDATGAPTALQSAVDSTSRGGVICVVGLTSQPVEINLTRLLLFEKSVVTSLGYANDLPRIASLIAARNLDAEPLITKVVPLADASEQIAAMAAGNGDDLKVLVRP